MHMRKTLMLITGAYMEKTPEKRILDILKEAKESLTVSKTAEIVKINRVTAAKYLAVLEAKGIVSRRDVGKAKLYSIKEAHKG